MEKVVRDGKVAVIYGPDYGGGWYSWYGYDQMLFDPTIVAMLEKDDVDWDAIQKYAKRMYDCPVPALEIVWVPEGAEFIIHEYDGSEQIWLKDKLKWLKA